MSGPASLTREDDIDVAGIFAALKKKWWLILLVTLLVGAGLLIVLSLISPRYESSARILVRDGDTTFTRATGDANQQNANPRFDEQAVRSEVEVLSSDKLALSVIDDLELAQLEEFEGNRRFADVRTRVLELSGQEERIEKARNTTPQTERRNTTLGIFKEKLQVYAIEKSRVIVVEFWSNDAELAQAIVRSLGDKYIKLKRNSEIANTENATQWLDPRIQELELDVTRTEAAVAEFRSNSDLLRADNNNALLATQQLSQVSTEFSRLKTERSSAQAQLSSIQAALNSGSSLDVIPEVNSSQLIQRLREREVNLRAQISELSTTLLPNHPRMKALASQLKDFQGQIRVAANNIVKSLKTRVDQTLKAEADLEKEMDRLKAEASRVDEKLVELRVLEREADAAKGLLQEYQSRALEVRSRSGLQQVDAEIISPASLPDEAYFPKIIPFTIAGMVAALLLSTLGVIAINLLAAVGASHEATAKRAEDEGEPVSSSIADDSVDAEPSVPPRKRNNFQQLQAIVNPEPVPAPQTAAVFGDNSEADQNETMFVENTSEQVIKSNRPFAIKYGAKQLIERQMSRISIVSPNGDAGSITTTLLARNIASQGNSVVVIDMGASGRSARKMLGKSGLPGLFNLLSGAVGVDAIIHKDKSSSVSVVPAGTMFGSDTEVDNNLIPEVVDAIAQSFDYCIIDCGDADPEDVYMLSDIDTAVVMSCVVSDLSQIETREGAFKENGFVEILRIAPSKSELRPAAQPVTA
jgi:uncharacterized protein involved in exopolysaccharide biosynthesis/Mrp family chromosome partitioning ATPase